MREVREDTEKDGDAGDKVEATDPDDDDLTYEITGGADMDKFTNDKVPRSRLGLRSSTTMTLRRSRPSRWR